MSVVQLLEKENKNLKEKKKKDHATLYKLRGILRKDRV